MDFWKKCNSRNFPFWSVGVLVGILFLMLGFSEGQFTEMYRKAVVICLECIGIG